MDFTKYHIAGKDYIYCADKTAFNNLQKTDIINLCDRYQGVGADGIFTFYQNNAKTSALKGFCENGEIMRDFSSTSICAVFELLCKTSITEASFLSENGKKISVKTDISNDKHIFSCGLEADTDEGIFNALQRKTEIGNRILTITPVYLHSIYSVHFTDCREKLNIEYLGKHISRNSLFKKEANMILTEQTASNFFDFSFYENKSGCSRPVISAFGAVALAACRNGYCKYEDGITVSCNNNNVFVVCHSAENISVKCSCEKIFTGNI